MNSIFTTQIDYIFFFYGLAFIFLAVMLFTLERCSRSIFPWKFLTLFSLVHGINEWLDMMAVSLGDSLPFALTRLVLMIGSFLFLAEFGRKGTVAAGGKAHGRWIILLLLVLSISGATIGIKEAYATTRYALGLIGGLWAAWALFQYHRHEFPESKVLIIAALGMGLYALSAGVIVPKAAMFPASVLNNDSFFTIAGFPIQLVRGLLAVVIAFAFWRHIAITSHEQRAPLDRRLSFESVLIILLCIVLISGWVATEMLGRSRYKEEKDKLVEKAKAVVASIDDQRIATIAGSGADRKNPDYIQLKEQLIESCGAVKDVRLYSVLGKTGNKIVSHTEPPRSGYSRDTVPTNKESSPKLAINKNDPLKNRQGSWITTFAPVKAVNGRIIAVLRMDVDASLWAIGIAKERMNAILIAMLMSLLIALFYVTLWRRMETRKAIMKVVGEQSLLLDTIDVQVWYLEDEQTYGAVNKSHAAFMGRSKEALEHRTLWEILPEAEARSVIDGNHTPFAAKNQIHTEEWLSDSEGKKHLLSITRTPKINRSGDVEYVVCSAEDITEQKLAEEEKAGLESQLAQSMKMEALGTLAGGIAHDFNNILTAIMGYTELGILNASKPEKVMKNLNDALKSSKRAKDFVNQILAFSRHAERKYEPIKLDYTIRESLRMLRSMIPTTIEIKQNLPSCNVMGDTAQFHQMLMNLTINAAQAIGEHGGVMEVSLEEVTLDETAGAGLDLPPGPYVKLMVNDTGHGMTPEVLSRIFEPYFTTKKGSTSSGMGLSIVHGIVKRHGGYITCHSEPGKGSAFEIFLPEIDSSEEAQPEPSCNEIVLPTGNERILVVDDEPALVDVEKKMLEDLGYKATAISSSVNALDMFKKNPYKFDLVITDMTMPDMTGYKLSQKIKEVRRDIPIILCTGYSEHVTVEKARNAGIREFIMKPFEMNDLARSIRNILDESRHSKIKRKQIG